MDNENNQNNGKNIPRWLLVLNGTLLIVAIFMVFAVKERTDKKIAIKQAETNRMQVASSIFDGLEIEANAVYVYDLAKKEIVFKKNENAQLPLASITKLMTALVASNLSSKNDLVTIRKEFLAPEGDTGLLSGENWTVRELLDLSLVTSSNDGVRSIASVIGSTLINKDDYNLGREEFVKKMNTTARELGLNQMYFMNESGLDENDNQSGGYGSAENVNRLVEYMLTKKSDILEMTKYSSSSVSSLTKVHNIENTNYDINKIPGLLASKTGYTKLAGGNLVIAFDSSIGRPIIITVLGSTQDGRFSDVLKLVDASMEYVQKTN